MRASTVPSAMSMSGRRAVAAAVAAAVVGVAFVPPAAGAPGPVPVRTVTSTECPVEAPDENAAAATAARCGREVEVLAERTEWQTLHALPDGRMRLDTSMSAQRTDISGEWTDIDTSLAETAEGIAPVASVVEMVFSDGAPDQPLARLARDGRELTFDVPFDVGAPVVMGSRLEYRDVLDGVDLIVTVNADGTGFSEVLRVASPEAAANPLIAELAFPVEVSGDLLLAESDGGFVATDASGEVVFTSPPPAMWDSRADQAAAAGLARPRGVQAMAVDGSTSRQELAANRAARRDAPVAGDQASVMDVRVDRGRGGRGEVVVTPDEELLAGRDTVWPVYIDPSVKGTRSEWVSIRDDGWTDYNYTGDQGVGRCGTTGSPMYCSSVFTRRAMWEFGDLALIGGAEPGEVTSATFKAYGTHSYSCTPAYVQAWQVGDVSSGTRWPGSFNSVLEAKNVAHKASCGNEGWVEFNVTAAAKNLASAGGSTLGIGLKAGDEGSSTGWKRYRYDAELSITYNPPPMAPAGLGFTSPKPAACVTGPSRPVVGANPTISGVFSDDQDQSPKDNVQARVDVHAVPTGIRSQLSAGEQLTQGQELKSADGRTKLAMQTDGNLVLYGPSGVLWHTATYGQGGVRVVMQGDGNLVMYTASNVPVWHIGANGLGGTRAVLQSDGNFVVYTATNGVVWHTNTPTVPPATPLWSATTAGQVSGATHSVTIPNLQDGKTYRVQVNGIDAGGAVGPSVSCEITVDTAKPAAPTVAPEPGGPAFYATGTETGGANVIGWFRFASTSTDVDRYLYGFDSTSLSQSTPVSSPVITYSPPSPGEHVLRVQAVDRAGNPSATITEYRFAVAKPQKSVWLLEEGTGTTAADSGDVGNQLPLTLSGSTSWVPGPLSEEGSGTDWALQFDGTADVASSLSPAVLAGQSFSVSAIVRSEGQASAATAVSQDGTTGPAFELGQVVGSQCPDGVGPCWAFQMPSPSGGGSVAAVFDGPVPSDEWVQVTGTFDAASGYATVHVCRPLWWGEPEPGGQVPASGSGLGVGPLRLGRSTVGGAPAAQWLGEIAEVRVYDAVIDADEEMTETCGAFVP